jgi:hypothetical protein
VLARFRLRDRLHGELGVSVRVSPPWRAKGIPSPQEEPVPSWMVPCTVPFTAFYPA